MARLRSSPRHATRHSGAQYEAGYQYRNPEIIVYRYGPWDRVLPLGRRDLPKNALAGLQDGVLIDGMIFPAWTRYQTNHLSQTVLGAYELELIENTYQAIFYRDRADLDKLKISYERSGFSAVFDTGLSVLEGRVSAVGWQNKIFFTHPSLTGVYRFDPLAGTMDSVIAGTQGGEHLFVLDNNLVEVFKSGSAYVVRWAVDSDPMNWNGWGSGQYVVPGHIGRVQSIGLLKDQAMILGSASAITMRSTGTLPPFRFADAHGFPGVVYKDAALGVGNTIFYIDYERRLAAYKNGENQPVGLGEARFETAPLLYHSRRLDLLIVSTINPEHTLFLDVNTLQWVSDLAESWTHASDVPTVSPIGAVIGFQNNGADHIRTVLNIGGDTFAMPEARTGLTRFGSYHQIHRIDVAHTDVVQYAPLLEALRLQENGQFSTTSYGELRRDDIRIIGQVARYYIDAPALALELHFLTPQATQGSFLLDPLTASGNMVASVEPTQGYARGDADIYGNIIPAEASRGYTIEALTEAGNPILVSNLDQWVKNIGVDYIEVELRSLTNEDKQSR